MSDNRAKVIQKALTDPAFKAELLKNPAAAVEKATGVKVPAGTTIKVVEDSGSVVHLVVPALPKAAMSDADLGKVAGGAGVPQLKTNFKPCDSTNGGVFQPC